MEVQRIKEIARIYGEMDELLRITYMLTDPVVMISVGIYITNTKYFPRSKHAFSPHSVPVRTGTDSYDRYLHFLFLSYYSTEAAIIMIYSRVICVMDCRRLVKLFQFTLEGNSAHPFIMFIITKMQI